MKDAFVVQRNLCAIYFPGKKVKLLKKLEKLIKKKNKMKRLDCAFDKIEFKV